jgi:hypothetical protein
MSEYDVWIDIITKVGFPIFVAIYQMVINTKATLELTKAVDKLAVVIDAIKER